VSRCQDCPVAPDRFCFGTVQPRLCVDVANGRPGRVEQLIQSSECPEGTTNVATPSPALLAAVVNCPDRGSVLPVPLQSECGCGGELSECRAGKGTVPGRVTVRDCLGCRRRVLGLS
jgi:hypothetical protein